MSAHDTLHARRGGHYMGRLVLQAGRILTYEARDGEICKHTTSYAEVVCSDKPEPRRWVLAQWFGAPPQVHECVDLATAMEFADDLDTQGARADIYLSEEAALAASKPKLKESA